jgi:RNA polymerase sigma factor (TIGR02999 family)
MSDGDGSAEEELFDRVYRRLRAIARHQRRRGPASATLRTTALVSEAYLRLARLEGYSWESRGHFLGVAAKAMRSVLVDHRRRHQRKKRDSGGDRLPLEDVVLAYEERASADLLALDAALIRLAAEEGEDGEAVRVLELRFFAGLTVTETAEVLGISKRSAERSWAYARSWLKRELS